jgi:hypothetical protein
VIVKVALVVAGVAVSVPVATGATVAVAVDMGVWTDSAGGVRCAVLGWVAVGCATVDVAVCPARSVAVPAGAGPDGLATTTAVCVPAPLPVRGEDVAAAVGLPPGRAVAGGVRVAELPPPQAARISANADRTAGVRRKLNNGI